MQDDSPRRRSEMEELEMGELFWEIHSGNPIEGPGEFQFTTMVLYSMWLSSIQVNG